MLYQKMTHHVPQTLCFFLAHQLEFQFLPVLFQEASHQVFYWRPGFILLITFPSSDLIDLLRMWLDAFHIAAFLLHFVLLVETTD